jgi:hypothetical protein
MPRGRKTKSNLEEIVVDEPTVAVGPANAVTAEERIKEIEAELARLRAEPAIEKIEPKKITKFCKIRFRNLYDPGINLTFTFNGKSFNFPDNMVIENVREEIVTHLNSCMIRKSRVVHKPDGSKIKEYVESPRFLCSVLETYEKEE